MRAVLAVAIVIVGIVLYAVFGSSTSVDGRRMRQLIVPSTGIPGLARRPTVSTAVAPSSSSYAAVRQAALEDPTATGTYQVAWSNRSKVAAIDVGFSLDVLPTAKWAHEDLREIVSHYTNDKQLSSSSLTLRSRFAVPGIRGAFGASYLAKTPGSSGGATSESTVYVVAFDVGRTAIVELIDSSTPAIATTDATKLARAQARHLRLALRGFSLAKSSREPLVALWFALGTVGAAGAAFFLPTAVRLFAERRAEMAVRAQVRSQRHVRSRGRKVVSRQRRRVTRVGARH